MPWTKKTKWIAGGGAVVVAGGLAAVLWTRPKASSGSPGGTAQTGGATTGTAPAPGIEGTTPTTLNVVGLNATASPSGTVVLRWAPTSAATAYKVILVSNGTVLATGLTARTYTVNKLTAGHTYTFGVYACNARGCGTIPAKATVTIPTTAPEPVPTTNPLQQYGESLSGKITPSQAMALYQQGKIAGPGFVVNGQWYQNLDQIPSSVRGSAVPNSTELATATSAGVSAAGEGGQSAYITDVLSGGISSTYGTSGSQQAQDAETYQTLGVIPSTAQTSNASSETAAMQSGIKSLLASGASSATIQNYLVQLYGFSPTVAAQEAAQGYPILQQTP